MHVPDTNEHANVCMHMHYGFGGIQSLNQLYACFQLKRWTIYATEFMAYLKNRNSIKAAPGVRRFQLINTKDYHYSNVVKLVK